MIRVLVGTVVAVAVTGGSSPRISISAPASIAPYESWTITVRGAASRPLVTVARGRTRRSLRLTRVRAAHYRGRLALKPGRWAYTVRVGRRTVARGRTIVRYPLQNPFGIALDREGRLIVADGEAGVVRVDSRTGEGARIAAVQRAAIDVAVDGGDLYAVDGRRIGVVDGSLTTVLEVGQPYALAVGSGTIYLADIEGSRIVHWAGGQATTVGHGFNRPHGVALDRDGTLVVADGENALVKRVRPDGSVTDIARVPGALSVAVGPAGDVYVAEVATNRVVRVTAAGLRRVGPAFADPSDVAVASDGTVYVVEHDGRRIRAVSASGRVRILAG